MRNLPQQRRRTALLPVFPQQEHSLAAQTGAFTLYEIIAGTKGTLKAKKLGQGGTPTELELKYGVREKMTA